VEKPFVDFVLLKASGSIVLGETLIHLTPQTGGSAAYFASWVPLIVSASSSQSSVVAIVRDFFQAAARGRIVLGAHSSAIVMRLIFLQTPLRDRIAIHP
jgi:hypothetical protein